MKIPLRLSRTPKRLNRTKTTLWNLFHLYFNVVIGIIRGILIIPLYLNFISAGLYGAWLATGNILMWLTLFDPGVGDVATQKIAEAYGKNDKTTIKYVISSSIFISSIICFLVLIIGISITDLLINFVRIPDSIDHIQLKEAFNVSIISTALTLFYFSLTGAITGFQETRLYGWIRNGSSLIALVINIILLFKGYQLLSIAYSGLIGALLQTILYGILLLVLMKREKISFRFSFSFLKNYSRIFSFTFANKLFLTIAQNIDLILVSRFVSVEMVTILEFSRRPLKVIRGLAISPSQAMLPTIAHLYGERNIERLKEIIDKSLRLFSFMLILIAAGFIAFNSSLLTLWVGGKYYIGDFLNLLLVLTFLFSTWAYIISNFTYSMGKIKQNSIFELIKNVLSIGFLILFGYLWGVKGIVLAALTISIISELLFFPYLLNKCVNFTSVEIKIFINEVLLSLIGTGIITYIFILIKPSSWFSLTMASAIFIILNLSLFFVISRQLRIELIQFIKTKTIFRRF